MSKIKLALDVVNDLRSLADSIETLAQAIGTNEPIDDATKTKQKKAKEPETKAPIEEVATEKTVEENASKAKTQEEKQPTLEEIRAAMADKSRDGHREAVKVIITKYGAGNLSALDPRYYAAALKEVGEIK